MLLNRFGHPFFYPSETGGYNFEQSDNPKNDQAIEGLDSSFSVSGGVITMKCSGPTSFSVGKNARGFSASIGGCNMDFKATAARGYAYKKDDVRDLEFKCEMQINGLQSGHDGFSMSACTGRHTGSNCCQGFAYMGSIEGAKSSPSHFRFRKETVHVQYTDSKEGTWTHPKCNFAIDGHGWIGFGFCRYNSIGKEDTNVTLEIWFNPDPVSDPTNWTMLKRHEDKPGDKWTGSAGKCNGDSDQIGTWSGAHNRLKSNSASGTIKFRNISFREINPGGTFESDPGGGGGGTLGKTLYYAMVSSGSEIGAVAVPVLSITVSHEIVETQTSTDPFGLLGTRGWKSYSTTPTIFEIADECNADDQYADGLWVNPYWSNSNNSCVIPHITEPNNGTSTRYTTKGGKILKRPGIWLIYWGTTWRDSVVAPTNVALTDMIQNKLLGTDVEYFSKLDQYNGAGIPVWKGAVFNVTTPIPSGTNISETVGRQVIVESFNTRLIPIDEADKENIYILVVPTGKFPALLEGSSALGFHNVFTAQLSPIPIPIPDPGGGSGGTPTPPPTTTTRVQGSLRLLWDINTVTGVGACSGSGGGGGGGGTAFAFYTELPDGTLGNNALDDHRTGIYETINTDTAAMKGKRPIRIDLWLAKVGSPAGTATVLHRAAPASGSYVKETFGTIDVTTLTTTETMYSFGPTAGTQDFNKNNKIGIEYSAGDSNNYITVARNKPGGFDGQKSFKVTKEDGVYVEALSLDLCAVIYEA